jgi:hypothetical protein
LNVASHQVIRVIAPIRERPPFRVKHQNLSITQRPSRA